MSRASGYEILQKGVDNMITGQIIQTSIDELKAITKVDLGVYDLNGSEVASTMERDDITTDLITGFAASPADSQVIGVHHLLKIRDEGELLYVLVARGMTDDVYMVGLPSARFRISSLPIKSVLTGTTSSRICYWIICCW